MNWIIALIIIAVLFIIFIIMYNSLVGKRNKVKNSWSQVDVQLKRRFDLIPNLVETVKGYAAHEKQTLDAVISARTKYLSSAKPEDMMRANNELTGFLNRLFAVAEQYPELKASANFMELQGELSKTEDKISYARQFYNDVVMEYNNTVQMFPSNIVASIFHFSQEPFFRAEESEKAAPQVKF